MRPHLRLPIAVGVSLAVATTVAFTSYPSSGTTPAADHSATRPALDKPRQAVAEEVHHHNDPTTKNAISRTTDADADTTDPTTPAQRASNARTAAAQRDETQPPLTHVPVDPPQPDVPTDRYNLFNACYGLQSTATHRWLQGTAFTAADNTGTPLYFKPTELGRYLLYSPQQTFLGNTGTLAAQLGYRTAPDEQANWTVTQAAPGQFRLFLPGAGYLSVAPTQAATFVAAPGDTTQFTPYKRSGCADFPEISTNVEGDPTAGTTPYEETRGYIDAHTHGMAFEFLGGDVHCGRPWSPWGVTVALKDCPDHYYSNGYGAVLEDFLSGMTHHDPVGWPTFKDWPAPQSLTHEGTYYKWMERSWRAGQRVLVNLLVENNQLCMIYPLKRNSCDDMKSIALQAKDMHLLENYVDAQHGGPGKGWYRIVTNPRQAREVINAGKMAVIMGIETSVPFGCHLHLGQPTCDAA
jgi:hypothetical protein